MDYNAALAGIPPYVEEPGSEILRDAVKDTVSKNYESAQEKIKEAINAGVSFSTEDLGILDHIYGHFAMKAKTDEAKVRLYYEWIETADRVRKGTSTQWLTHYQMSVYYCYHMIGHTIQSAKPKLPDCEERLQNAWEQLHKTYSWIITMTLSSWHPSHPDRLDIFACLALHCLVFARVVDKVTVEKIQQEVQSTKAILQELHHENTFLIRTKTDQIEQMLQRCLDCRRRLGLTFSDN